MFFPRFFKFSLAVAIAVAIFGGGFYLGRQKADLNPKGLEGQQEGVEQAAGQLDLTLFWKALELLRQHYLEQARLEEPQKLIYGAIAGMVEALDDPYTAFYTPEENTQFKEGLEGLYEGIGAQLGFRDHQLMVVAPLKSSPAEAGGVRAGDEILAVDGESTFGWSLPKAVSKIRGETGSRVALSLRRGKGTGDDREILELEIERQRINVPSILVKWVGPSNKIAHLEMLRFGPDTKEDWQKTVSQILKESAQGVILDLRGNPGGFLEAAVFVSSEFFNKGVVVQREFANSKTEEYRVEHAGRLTKLPVAVLVDRGSASASEIVACALQARERGQLVGEKTFGKGSIQEAIDLDGGAGIHITSARWLCPDGSSVDKAGLEPDVMIERSEEDVKAGKDPQLRKAVELLIDRNST